MALGADSPNHYNAAIPQKRQDKTSPLTHRQEGEFPEGEDEPKQQDKTRVLNRNY